MTITIFRPNGDDQINNFLDETLGATNIYTSIDEVVEDAGDYIGSASASGAYRCQVDTAAAVFSGPIVELRVKCIAEGFPFGDPNGTLAGGVRIDGGTSMGTPAGLLAGVPQEYSWPFPENPSTGNPWTQQDIRDFDGADSIRFAWERDDPDGRVFIRQAWIEVETARRGGGFGHIPIGIS